MALINYLPVENSKDEENTEKFFSKKRKMDPKKYFFVII